MADDCVCISMSRSERQTLSASRFEGDQTLEEVHNGERLLRVGERGPAVVKIQEALLHTGFDLPQYGADGHFGAETEAAVKAFQRDAGLTGRLVDGVVGPLTLELLDQKLVEGLTTVEVAETGLDHLVPLPNDVVDRDVTQTIEQELEAYQNIPIDVTDVPDGRSAGSAGPGGLTVQATYYINTATRRERFEPKRATSGFNEVVASLQRRDLKSIIQSTRGDSLSAGHTVRFGKATPDDLRKFVQEAVDQGVLRQVAETDVNGPVVDLEEGDLQDAIQKWINYNGVGVDCSGFVLYAMIRVREQLRSAAETNNQLLEWSRVPHRFSVPEPFDHRIRNARSFIEGPEVTSPVELRPGDAWVTRSRAHIRIVTAVREVTLADGTNTFEFDTAESTSVGVQPGPIARTWRTESTTAFHQITDKKGASAGGHGTFHRIP